MLSVADTSIPSSVCRIPSFPYGPYDFIEIPAGILDIESVEEKLHLSATKAVPQQSIPNMIEQNDVEVEAKTIPPVESGIELIKNLLAKISPRRREVLEDKIIGDLELELKKAQKASLDIKKSTQQKLHHADLGIEPYQQRDKAKALKEDGRTEEAIIIARTLLNHPDPIVQLDAIRIIGIDADTHGKLEKDFKDVNSHVAIRFVNLCIDLRQENLKTTASVKESEYSVKEKKLTIIELLNQLARKSDSHVQREAAKAYIKLAHRSPDDISRKYFKSALILINRLLAKNDSKLGSYASELLAKIPENYRN